jgi:hypothetical protein
MCSADGVRRLGVHSRRDSVALRISRLYVAVEPGGVDPDLATNFVELRNELQQQRR